MNFEVFVSTIFVIFSTINLCFCEEVQNGTQKIVGGQITEIESVPYLVSIMYHGGKLFA